MKEFSSNSDLSNWFSREEVGPAKVVVKKPNPRNVQNIEKIKELEEQIQKYGSSSRKQNIHNPTSKSVGLTGVL